MKHALQNYLKKYIILIYLGVVVVTSMSGTVRGTPASEDENFAFGKMFTQSDGTGPWLEAPRMEEWKALCLTHLWSSILMESGLGPHIQPKVYGEEKPRSINEFKYDAIRARAFVDTLHRNGIRAWGYLAGTYFWADPEKRNFFLDFYDNHWDKYKDELGLGSKPTDPITWLQIGPDSKPFFMLYRYNYGHGDVFMPHLAVSPFSPDWRAYDKAVLRFFIEELGIDGIEIDEVYVGHAPAATPLGTFTFDHYTIEHFKKFLNESFNTTELKDLFGIEDLDQIEPSDPAFLADQLRKNVALKFVWNEFQAMAIADFLADLTSYAHELKSSFEVGNNNYVGNGNIYFQFQRLGINPEVTINVVDYLRSEMAHSTFPRLLGDKKQSNSPIFKYLKSVAEDKPVVVINNRGNIPPVDLDNVYKAMIAEATMNGITLAVERGADKFLSEYFKFLKLHQDLLVGSNPTGRVAVWCSMQQAYADKYTLALTVSRILSDNHILHRIILDRDLKPDVLSNYSVLILPYVPMMTDQEISTVMEYVKSGGRVIIIGKTAYFKEFGLPRETPGFVNIFGSELPGEVTRVKYCSGEVVYIPYDESETNYFEVDPSLDPSNTFPELVDTVPLAVRGLNNELLDGDIKGPSTVEYNLMRLPDGRLVVHLVNYNIGNGKLAFAENIEVRIALGDKIPSKVILFSPDGLYNGLELDVTLIRKNGENYVGFTVPRIQIYDLVVIECHPSSEYEMLQSLYANLTNAYHDLKLEYAKLFDVCQQIQMIAEALGVLTLISVSITIYLFRIVFAKKYRYRKPPLNKNN